MTEQATHTGMDAPDGPGHWALEARIIYKKQYVDYKGTAYIFPDDVLCKRVRVDGKMLNVSDVKGKWYRLRMPWEVE